MSFLRNLLFVSVLSFLLAFANATGTRVAPGGGSGSSATTTTATTPTAVRTPTGSSTTTATSSTFSTVRTSSTSTTSTSSTTTSRSSTSTTSSAISTPTSVRYPPSSYWYANIKHGIMPYAPSGYQVYRNVRDFGAKGDGVTDDTAAINRALSVLSSSTSQTRCGLNCAATSTQGAVIFFPAGTYLISSPLIQYYYTQFIGDPNNKPTIKGAANFAGIALIDTDPYLPGGAQWYGNTNQFYRSIRNFVMDMRSMARQNTDSNGQNYVPTGIHWQVAQATSLQNIDFLMATSDQNGAATAVGLFAENGSGGFVSDLTFTGGNYGMKVGAQQFTMRGLKFNGCLKAISQVWDWGWTWKNIEVNNCYVAIECKGNGPGDGPNLVIVQDSRFVNVPYGITITQGTTPNIVLDNLSVTSNSGSVNVVQYDGGAALLSANQGTTVVQSWAFGKTSITQNSVVSQQQGTLSPAPSKPGSLLAGDGTYFVRSRPLYETLSVSSFVVATDNGISNAGTGDQTAAINSFLASAVSAGKIAYFPAGVYRCQGTINVPVNSRIVGEAWSQIMAAGSYFSDAANPKVLFKVGNAGDRGSLEISDILFTVQGATAGAILVEWNVAASSAGAAGMWDAHFRVGGAVGSNLQVSQCPKGSNNAQCQAAAMMLHVTTTGTGYFENVWAWVADHDIDTSDQTQINIFGGRGVLIESKGPAWFYGTASEHSALYQYQLLNAQNIYMGLSQTETPYYQPSPPASQSVRIGTFPGDPTFANCAGSATCNTAWATRILSSSSIFWYGSGFYSFFSNYVQDCLQTESCQDRLVDTSYTQGLWIYGLFTKGAKEVISPRGLQAARQQDSQNGFTTGIAAWLQLATSGGNLGNNNY